MATRRIGNITIECIRGNIVNQYGIDAIVNAANAELRLGGGVAGAIHRAAGPRLAQECRPLAPIKPGEAVITGAHNLENKYVIHCLGPVYGHDEPSDVLLANCYRNALKLAEENSVQSIAFPSISTGAFGYPMEEATRIALTAVLEELPRLSSVNFILFVQFQEADQRLHVHLLDELIQSRHG